MPSAAWREPERSPHTKRQAAELKKFVASSSEQLPPKELEEIELD